MSVLTSEVQREDDDPVEAEHAEDAAEGGEEEALAVRPGLHLAPGGLLLAAEPPGPRLLSPGPAPGPLPPLPLPPASPGPAAVAAARPPAAGAASTARSAPPPANNQQLHKSCNTSDVWCPIDLYRVQILLYCTQTIISIVNPC